MPRWRRATPSTISDGWTDGRRVADLVERGGTGASFCKPSQRRAALKWCFGANGSVEIGIRLAAAAAPVFLAMSLLIECHRWSKRAILAIDEATRGSAEEMHIQAALGLSLMFTLGNSELARVALSRSLAIAEDRDDVTNQLQLLGRMHIFHERMGHFETALRHARRSSLVSATLADPSAIAVSQSLLGVSLHLAEIILARVPNLKRR